MGYDMRDGFPGYHAIIGESQAMKSLFEDIDAVAAFDSSVLLVGERGTGKELVAHAIHEKSKRHENPFVEKNCAAIPDTLFESEMFGHVRGSFTGAHRDKRGFFQSADGGTGFLDEVGELTAFSQPKLLNALETGECSKIGSTKKYKFDVRLITATSRDPYRMVSEGKFRPELLDRINVIPLQIPSLTERRGDIKILSKYFLEKLNQKYMKKKSISPKVMGYFVTHNWPGNVRELKSSVEKLYVMSNENSTISMNHVEKYMDLTFNEKTDLLSHIKSLPLMEKRFPTGEFAKISGFPYRSYNRIKSGINNNEYGITDSNKYIDPTFREVFDFCDKKNKRKISRLLQIAYDSVYK